MARKRFPIIKLPDGTTCSAGPECRIHSGISGAALDKARIDYLKTEWHPSKNLENKFENFSAGSNKKVWWQCPVASDHEWQAPMYSRTSGKDCPFCSGNFPSSTNNLFVFKGPNSSQIISEWHKTLNEKTPMDYVIGSTRKVWWQCSINPKHVWEMGIRKRTERGQGCVYCAGRYVSEDSNLLTTHPEFAAQFNEKKNGIKVSEISIGIRTRYYWTCSNGHEMYLSPHNRSRANSICQQCNQSGVSTFENNLRDSLKTYIKKIDNGVARLPIKWRKNSGLTVDISGEINGQKFAVEYDSEYWHHTKANTFDRDYAKSIALLNAGYKVLRVREGNALSLLIEHKMYQEIQFDIKRHKEGIDSLAQEIYSMLMT